MKFQSFRCDCGFICISPAMLPKCAECGRLMRIVTDEKDQAEIDRMIRPMIGFLVKDMKKREAVK